MTLEAYTNLNKNSFVYDLEFGADLLGSITGSTAFKFGIYHQRSPKQERDKQYTYDTVYAWRTQFGKTPEQAFKVVRDEVVRVARLARAGNYKAIDESPLYPIYKWKIAFLYQDRDNPGVIPLYAGDVLRFLAEPFFKDRLPSKYVHHTLYETLISEHLSKTANDLISLGPILWETWRKSKDDEESWLIPLDGIGDAQQIARGQKLDLNDIRSLDSLDVGPKVHDWLALSLKGMIISRGKILGLKEGIVTWKPQEVRRPSPPTKKGEARLLTVPEQNKIWPVPDKQANTAPIQSIRIRHFRSIMDLRIEDCKDLNIISGSNDVGKSNILRSLQLFFENAADWQRPLIFKRDFNIQRNSDAREKKVKKIIAVMVTFNVPGSLWKSLPKQVEVTRQWDMDENRTERDNLETLWKKGKLPATLTAARQSLSRFMNRLHFEYVPAVKDRAYYEHILEKLQSGVFEQSVEADSRLGDMAKQLAALFTEKIPGLQREFSDATKLETVIASPDVLTDFFQTLKVNTYLDSTEKKEQVPLLSRGDGIQARYVASVLHYVSKSKSDSQVIWGFEEPENSLEYRHTIDLARDFYEKYAENAQIFTTTHSPAFLALENKERCQLYRAYQDEAKQTQLACDGALEQLQNELGILRIHQELHEIYEQKMAEFEAEREARHALLEEIECLKMPVLLTEGKTDIPVLEVAWRKLFDCDPPFIIRGADTSGGHGGGNGGASKLPKMIAHRHPDEKIKVIAIFDRDQAGIEGFASKDLKSDFSKWAGRDDVKAHRANTAFAMLLPVPEFRTGREYSKKIYIEHMFRDEVLRGKYGEHQVSLSRVKHAKNPLKGITFKDDAAKRDAEAKYKAFLETIENSVDAVPEPTDDSKVPFAEKIVPSLPPKEFEAFRPLFETVMSILAS